MHFAETTDLQNTLKKVIINMTYLFTLRELIPQHSLNKNNCLFDKFINCLNYIKNKYFRIKYFNIQINLQINNLSYNILLSSSENTKLQQ